MNVFSMLECPTAAGITTARNVELKDVFTLQDSTVLERGQSYIRAYPHFLAALAPKSGQPLTAQDFVCGAHMVYGWMPTILDIYVSDEVGIDKGVEILNKARLQGALSVDEIHQLASLVNRSVVGASKLLHFVNPEAFAIWDSRIYRFHFNQTAHQNRVNNAAAYERYLKALHALREDPRFPAFHDAINRKMGYDVSALRALEVVMFLNA